MTRIAKTTTGPFLVSTVALDATTAETMVFRDGDEVDSIRVPVANAGRAHKHMVNLYRLGDLASYYSKSAGESVARSVLRNNVRTLTA
jgi:hypothetical protein